MENDLINAFLPAGVAGRDGAGVSVLKTDIAPIFALFRAFAERSGAESGVVYPYELDRYTVYKKKKSFFRPTDVIYTADFITSNKKTAKKADHYIGGLYSLYVSCRSFTIDTSLIGENDINILSERIYFVIPKGKTGLIKKIASFTSGLRKCGVVTSDGMIRFIRNGIADEFSSSLVPCVEPLTHEIDSPYDFNVGCFAAFEKLLEKKSKYRFPYPNEKLHYSDRFSYKLGYLAVSSRDTSNALHAFYTEPPIVCAGFLVSVIPIWSDNGVFPIDRAFSYIPSLEAEANSHSYFAYTAFYGSLKDYVNRFHIMAYTETAVPQSDGGYIIIISDTPTSHSHIGYLLD